MIDQIISLFYKAINGQLSINELEQKWPESLKDNLFFEELYDDLESAVEHMPGKSIFSKDINLKKFKNTIEYKIIIMDFHLIKTKIDLNSMITKRQHLLNNLNWSHDEISAFLNTDLNNKN